MVFGFLAYLFSYAVFVRTTGKLDKKIKNFFSAGGDQSMSGIMAKKQ